jgi:hypothetical protein
MNFENRNVNGVSFTCRAFIDKGASAIIADALNQRLSRSECEAAANPVMRVPGREIRFHSRNPGSRIYEVRPELVRKHIARPYSAREVAIRPNGKCPRKNNFRRLNERFKILNSSRLRSEGTSLALGVQLTPARLQDLSCLICLPECYRVAHTRRPS